MEPIASQPSLISGPARRRAVERTIMNTEGKSPAAMIMESMSHERSLPYPAASMCAPMTLSLTIAVTGARLESGSGGSASSTPSAALADADDKALTETGTTMQAVSAIAPTIAIRNGMVSIG